MLRFLISFFILITISYANQADEYISAAFAGKNPKLSDYSELSKLSKEELQKQLVDAVDRYNEKNFRKPKIKKEKKDKEAKIESSNSTSILNKKVEVKDASSSGIGGMSLKVITSSGVVPFK